jgi:hypothetical protein
MSVATGARPGPRLQPMRWWWYLSVIPIGLGVAQRGIVVAVLAMLALLGLLAVLHLRTWAWATGALVVTVLTEAAARAGVLPDVATFADFGFVYLGLAAVLLRSDLRWTPAARRLAIALGTFLIVTCMSAILHQAEVLRPLVAFSIWAESFVLLLLFLLDPPTEVQRRRLLVCLGVLIAVQLPIVVVQAATLGIGDNVRGTTSNAHTVAALTSLGGLALVTWGYERSVGTGLVCLLAAAPYIAVVPLLAEAKQVIFAMPVAVLVLVATTRRLSRKVMFAAVLAAVFVYLTTSTPAGQLAESFLGRASAGNSGKLAGFMVAVDEMRREWTGVAFGLGPANGLSRTALLTADTHALREGAPLGRLNLAPAELAGQAEAEASIARGQDDSSFNSAISSATGLVTDFGIVGLVTFGWLLASVLLPLVARRRRLLARVALAAWAISVPLALTFDWWEQPPFMIPLAVVTGLAITPPIGHRRRPGPIPP